MGSALLFTEDLKDHQTTFDALCNEVRTAFRQEKHCFERAIERVFRKHDVATAFTREVLACELRADIKKDRIPSSLIPYSPEAFTEYVRVLLHYKIPFLRAMERSLAQFEIRNYSDTSSFLFDRVSDDLNQRSLASQRRNLAFNPMG